MINLHLTKITKLFDLENLELYGIRIMTMSVYVCVCSKTGCGNCTACPAGTASTDPSSCSNCSLGESVEGGPGEEGK